MEKVVSSRAMVFGRIFLPLLPTYSITMRERNCERVECRVHSLPWNTSSINSPPPHPTQILHCRDCLNLAPSLVLSYIQMVDRKSRGVLVWLSAWLVCCLVSWKSQSFLVTAPSVFPLKKERGCSKMTTSVHINTVCYYSSLPRSHSCFSSFHRKCGSSVRRQSRQTVCLS